MRCSLAVSGLDLLPLLSPGAHDRPHFGLSVAFTLADGVHDRVVGIGVVRLVPFAISFLRSAHCVLPHLVLLEVQLAIAISVSLIPGIHHSVRVLCLEGLIVLVLVELLQTGGFLLLCSVGLPLGVLLCGPGVDELHRCFTDSNCFCHSCDLKVCFWFLIERIFLIINLSQTTFLYIAQWVPTWPCTCTQQHLQLSNSHSKSI